MSSQENAVRDPRHTYMAASFERISPLYHQFFIGMQDDPEMQALLALVDTDQPNYVLFFSVVNLLAKQMQHPLLSEFYPYFCEEPRPASQVYPVLREFCLSYQEELGALLPGAVLQTNEVTRCANLLPAFEIVSRRAGRQPLALIEVGTSAGLNLNWDRYRYCYGDILVGDQHSPVLISCSLKGSHQPPLPEMMPLIAERLGIDRAPIDPSRPLEVDWLLACIWPEEIHRYQLLTAALEVAQQHPPKMLPGDACELLPDVIASLPSDVALCLWHSYALSQGPKVVYERVVMELMEASQTREIYHLSLEFDPARAPLPRLELFTYRAGKLASYDWLATCEVHGDEMEWHCFSTSVQP